MFDGPEFPKSLDESVFNTWLERGRESKLGYHYLLVVWDSYSAEFQPVYVERREQIDVHRASGNREQLIAAYDLFSESRIV